MLVVKAGEVIRFGIISGGTDMSEKELVWTVSAGTIIEGQGTRAIAVQTSPAMFPNRPRSIGPPADPGAKGIIFRKALRGDEVPFIVQARLTSGYCFCSSPTFTAYVGESSKGSLENRFADVTRLRLSENQIIQPCRPGIAPMPGLRESPDSIVDIETTAFDLENDVLTYNYEVSGGRIIGSGPRVKWDLKDATSGSYTIKAGVDDGCGICGATKTEEITITECKSLTWDTVCPEIQISGPDSLKPGAENLFTANVSGAGGDMSITFTWSATLGEIVSGQGTPWVKVRMPIDAMNKPGTVNVTIGGLDPFAFCPDRATTEFVNGRKKP